MTSIFTAFLALFAIFNYLLDYWAMVFNTIFLLKYGVVKKYYQFAVIIDDVLLLVFAVLFT